MCDTVGWPEVTRPRGATILGAMRTTTLLVTVAMGIASLAACGGSPAAAPPAMPDMPGMQTTSHAQVEAAFAAPGGDNRAVTYDPALVPVGATALVVSGEADGKTIVTLSVDRLLPYRAYGAHAHVKPCGADGMAAGPHYQFRPDPVTPSVDPAYANPQNEIWLDFTTNAAGTGTTTTTVPWVFPADSRAKSVIIHEKTTATEAGKAGTAGARPACLNVDF